MPRNVVIVGLGEKSINLVIEEDLSVVSLKERICQRKVGLVYKTSTVNVDAFMYSSHSMLKLIASFWLIMGSLWMTPLLLGPRTTRLLLSGPIPSSEVEKEVRDSFLIRHQNKKMICMIFNIL